MSRTTNAVVEALSYRTLVKYAKSLCLPGNLKKEEYIKLVKLRQMGFEVEYKTLAHMMKTNKQTTQSSISKNTIQKRSVGRPRKLKIRVEPVSNTLPNYIQMSGTKNVPNKKIQTLKPLKSNSDISKAQMSSTSSLQNITHQPPITKTTSQLLRNMLLSSDRSKFHKSATHFKSNNEKSYNYYQPKWKNNGNIQNSNLSTYDIKPTIPVSYLPDLQSFPDIPQLADVDINASLDLDNSNFRMNYQTDVDTGFCGDGSDTLSNQSAEITEQEQRDIDQRWAMSIRMENGMTGTPFANHDTFNPFDNSSLLGPQDTALVQNDVIQNYIETNDVQFMQLPDSGCEVIKTLQYYESRLSNPWSLSENNGDGSVISNESVQNEQLNLAESNHTLAEFANMLPCPIAGCLWYSHSATLYVHLCTCHQDMIYYGNLITHIFRCQDIHNFCFFTHLQYVQNTIYIITVAFDPYSRVFVATIQHVSSYGDNTSVLSTTAVLTSGFLHNNNVSQNSWTGHVQPYIVPLDVLHNDERKLKSGVYFMNT